MTDTRRPPHHQQQEALRKAAHKDVDELFDVWEDANRQSKEMGRGLPSRTSGPIGKGGVSDPVGELVASEQEDPAQRADDFLTRFRDLRTALENLAGEGRNLKTVDPDSAQIRRMRERQSTVSNCMVCGQMALPRAKRGMCEACYKAWIRDGRPDVERFKAERTSWDPKEAHG